MPHVLRPGGCSVHFNVVGSGMPLVMLGGLGLDERGWANLLPILTRRYRCVIVDSRGGGLSSRSRGFWGAGTMADDTAAVLQAAGIEQAAVLGNSLGGIVAQAFARRHPEMTRCLVLLETSPGLISIPPSLRRLWRAHPGAADRIVRSCIAIMRRCSERLRIALSPDDAHAPRGDPGPGQERLAATPPQHLKQVVATLTWVGVLRLRRVRVPALIVHASGDPLIPVANARLMHRALRGSRLVIVPASGHRVIGEATREVVEAITSFLDECGGAASAAGAA